MDGKAGQNEGGEAVLSVETDPDPRDIARLDQGLSAHAAEAAVPFERYPLLIAVRAPDGTFKGGLLANWYRTHGAVIVKDLWVDPSLRGQGWGRMLMMRLEEEALVRGCTLVHLDTFEFQARGFYEKLGYQIDGSVRYPKSGYLRYFLSKNLA